MATPKRTPKRTERRFRLNHVLVCDEVRPELGGKLSLLGYYGGDTIVIGTEAATLDRLAFVFGFYLLNGDFPEIATFRLSRAEGEAVVPDVTVKLSQPGTSHYKNVIVQTSGVPVQVGTYKVSLTLVSEELASEFRIECNADKIRRINEAAGMEP